jgi:hypothetical protein
MPLLVLFSVAMTVLKYKEGSLSFADFVHLLSRYPKASPQFLVARVCRSLIMTMPSATDLHQSYADTYTILEGLPPTLASAALFCIQRGMGFGDVSIVFIYRI